MTVFPVEVVDGLLCDKRQALWNDVAFLVIFNEGWATNSDDNVLYAVARARTRQSLRELRAFDPEASDLRVELAV